MTRKIDVAIYCYEDERFENYTFEIEGKINRTSVEKVFNDWIRSTASSWKLHEVIAWSIIEE